MHTVPPAPTHMNEHWTFHAPFRLTRTQYRQGFRLYLRHRMGGWQVVGALTTGTVICLGTAGTVLVDAFLTRKLIDDNLIALVMTVLIAIVLGAALIAPLLLHDPATRPDEDFILRCNEFDIEIEHAGKTRRWGWPLFWVYIETPDVYVLMRQSLHLILPKTAVPPEHRQWFYLMAQQSTSPRRDFEVLIPNPPPNPQQKQP